MEIKCISCHKPMNLVFCNDTGSTPVKYLEDEKEGSLAYNVYHCDDCYIICRENVWDNPGIIWVYPTNKVTFCS